MQALWAPQHRTWPTADPLNVGWRWTSSSTPLPTADRSRSCPLWMNSRECLGGLVEGDITHDTLIDGLDRLAVDRGHPAAPAPSSPALRWPIGPANASACTSFRPADPGSGCGGDQRLEGGLQPPRATSALGYGAPALYAGWLLPAQSPARRRCLTGPGSQPQHPTGLVNCRLF
jgi:hypothetical protein